MVNGVPRLGRAAAADDRSAWEGDRRGGAGETARWRTRYSSDCRGRWRCGANSTWSSNNIANINTTGFKADNAVFEEFLMPVARADRFAQRRPQAVFVHDRAHLARPEPGPDASRPAIRSTSPSTARPSWWCRRRSGERYTRNGSLQINATGQLVTTRRLRRCSAKTARSQFQTDRQGHRDQPRRHHRVAASNGTRAASCAWSTSQTPQQLQKDGANLRGAGRRAAARRAQMSERDPGLAREIQRQRRRRNDADDRGHPHLHPGRRHAAAAGRTAPHRRSSNSPKYRRNG